MLKLVHSADSLSDAALPPTIRSGADLLRQVLADGILLGDAQQLIGHLPRESVDLCFTSPPYADARAYSRIHPDRYVE